jgi:hypothetical protein
MSFLPNAMNCSKGCDPSFHVLAKKQFFTGWRTKADVRCNALCGYCNNLGRELGQQYYCIHSPNNSPLICRDCYEKNSKVNPSRNCNICIKSVQVSFKRNDAACALIGAHKVRCPKFDKGCKAEGFVCDDFPENHEAFCHFKEVTCICGQDECP